MAESRKRGALLVVVILVAAAAVFCADLMLELGVAGGVPYVAVVCLAYWWRYPRWIWFVAAGCCVLTVVGYYLSPPGGEAWKVIFNRSLAPFAIVVTATLCDVAKRAHELLRKSEQELQRRVEERTAGLVRSTAKLQTEQQLLRRLIDLQEQERRMVAHDIHDGFVQDVAGAHFSVQGIHSGMDQDKLQKTVDDVASLLSRAIAEGRRLIRDLRPMVLDEQGIVEALRHLIADEQQQGDMIVAFDHDVRFDRLEPKLEGVVFRIVQEALNNTKQPGKTDHALVTLTQQNGRLEVVVQDQGVGFDPNTITRESFGLRGIRERARLFGGAARIESAPGEGTTVYAELPIVQTPGTAGE